MDLQSIIHWIYVAGMAIGALHFWSLSRNGRGVPQHEYLVAIFIPIWSGLAYMAMALDQGKVEASGQIAHYARYIDWIVTTPLLLLSLSWTAMQFTKKDWTLIGFLMSTQVVVITSGLIADLSEQDWIRYLWDICGVVAFLIVLWGIWNPLRAKSKTQTAELSNLYNKLVTYFTVLWICYPIVWIIGPSGFGWINQTIETFLFCLIPFFSKVGFSFLDLHGLRNLQDSRPTTGDRFVENTFKFVDNITAFGRTQRQSSRRRV
ncbi:bacteriorhodopsin [Nostoc sp. FACHB-110]|uniref:bacteriorhodopsin n=1 Tax=Nostoc sp. FACHB-110 TaxID=2692834 RepID=UPI0016870F7A|nr:bacteriorhodopsin [Nostoc sp. FACHB-110]MBD2440929.1 bacteriorhodopsin [Nostoc sp. FACHB-110]